MVVEKLENLEKGTSNKDRQSHTWYGTGPLGITIKAKSPSPSATDGVKIKKVDREKVSDIPSWVVPGLMIIEVQGIDVSKMSYSQVKQVILESIRPLTITLSKEPRPKKERSDIGEGRQRAGSKKGRIAEIESPIPIENITRKMSVTIEDPLEKSSVLKQIEAMNDSKSARLFDERGYKDVTDGESDVLRARGMAMSEASSTSTVRLQNDPIEPATKPNAVEALQGIRGCQSAVQRNCATHGAKGPHCALS